MKSYKEKAEYELRLKKYKKWAVILFILTTMVACILQATGYLVRDGVNTITSVFRVSIVFLLILPTILAVTELSKMDEKEVELYADYLQKLDELKEKRQAHKSFCADNGA
jgi:ABC-type transport system involved in cytochrome bd biosynthesis fused ATPase/permease subunit